MSNNIIYFQGTLAIGTKNTMNVCINPDIGRAAITCIKLSAFINEEIGVGFDKMWLLLYLENDKRKGGTPRIRANKY